MISKLGMEQQVYLGSMRLKHDDLVDTDLLNVRVKFDEDL